MASRTARIAVLRGRPPGYTGIRRWTKAHCSSVRSLGYRWVRIPHPTRSDPPYRTASYKLVQAGLEPHLPRVPGFHVVEEASGSRCWTVGGHSGLLFPVRDAAGQIVALSVRRDEEGDGGKYSWLSSKRKGGASPGNPIHVPQFDGDKTVVRVTEGALKANVATHLSGILTIGLP